jgi:DNA repair ATPase RecN
MDNEEVKTLIEAFRGYRDLLTPVQKNLNDFIETYDLMRDNIDKLNAAFGGDLKGRIEEIFKNLSRQAGKAADLSSRIDQLTGAANRYTSEVAQLVSLLEKTGERISSVNELEKRAEAQIGRLDVILEEKNKNYNLKELQRTLDGYNSNVQKVSEFINKDVADTLFQSRQKLDSIKGGIENIANTQRNDNIGIEKLLESYQSAGVLLKRIADKEDVNEAYIFEILDRWADSRRVKTKKP